MDWRTWDKTPIEEGDNPNWKNATNIEYVRKDTFIEKANKWLSINMKMLMNVLDVEYDTHDTDIKDFIEDFKKYMED
jgi:hypothetical protein